jgi:quercetin dioxygenase-like cupin family protein
MPKDATQPGSVSRENAEHYRWGNDCDGWHLVKDENLSVIEEFIPSGACEARHYHQRAQQFFYILSGEVMMEVEGQTTLLAELSQLSTPDSVKCFGISRGY